MIKRGRASSTFSSIREKKNPTMPKVKTTDRLKRHRYQPTKIEATNGENEDVKNDGALPAELASMLELSPSNVMEAVINFFFRGSDHFTFAHPFKNFVVEKRCNQ